MRQHFGMIIAALALLPLSARAESKLQWENYTVRTRAGAVIEVRRALLDVPQFHARATGSQIRLPVIRLPATTPNAGPPIIWLSGGPGESGTARVVDSYPLFEKLRAYGDVIAFDQRGTGKAEPSLALSGNFDLPSDHSIDSAQARQRLADLAGEMRTRLRVQGVDLDAYNTRESADDVESLRQALGVNKIVLVAHSYGTHLALAVLKRHGAHISRSILAGVNGLDARWREPMSLDQWLDRVADKVQRDEVWATKVPDFVARVRRVLAELDRNPIMVSTPSGNVLIGKAEIQVLVTLRSGDLNFIRELPRFFDNLERRTHLEELATLIQKAIRQRPLGTAMTYAMHVASGVSPQRLRDIDRQTPSSVFGNAINWGIGDEEFVRALNVPDLGERFRKPIRSNTPVLMISGTLDGRASNADAHKAGEQMRQATYITIDGASHDFLFREPVAGLSEQLGMFLEGGNVSDATLDVSVRFLPPE